jgi:hypothetical protein
VKSGIRDMGHGIRGRGIRDTVDQNRRDWRFVKAGHMRSSEQSFTQSSNVQIRLATLADVSAIVAVTNAVSAI